MPLSLVPQRKKTVNCEQFFIRKLSILFCDRQIYRVQDVVVKAINLGIIISILNWMEAWEYGSYFTDDH